MEMRRRTHRSFVSYIDRSREYYAAQGYEQPYRWVAHETVPFTSPRSPLSQSRIGLVTTAALPRRSAVADAAVYHKEAYATSAAAVDGPLWTEHLFWAKEETTTDDLGSYLPLAHLDALAAEGVVGDVSPRFYGVPTVYSTRRTQVEHAPAVLEWMRADDVDLALLVPL